MEYLESCAVCAICIRGLQTYLYLFHYSVSICSWRSGPVCGFGVSGSIGSVRIEVVHHLRELIVSLSLGTASVATMSPSTTSHPFLEKGTTGGWLGGG